MPLAFRQHLPAESNGLFDNLYYCSLRLLQPLAKLVLDHALQARVGRKEQPRPVGIRCAEQYIRPAGLPIPHPLATIACIHSHKT